MTLVLTDPDKVLTSGWSGSYIVGGGWEYSTPTTAYAYSHFTVPVELAGAIIHSVNFVVRYGSAAGSGSCNTDSNKILKQLRNGAQNIDITYWFTADGGYGQAGYHSETMTFYDISITIEYAPATDVHGTLVLDNGYCSYNMQENSLQLSEPGHIILGVTPYSEAVTSVTVDIGTDENNYVSVTYDTAAPRQRTTNYEQSYSIAELTLSQRVSTACIRIHMNEEVSAWQETDLKLISQRVAPTLSAAFSDETSAYATYGKYVQGKSVLAAAVSVTLDTDADSDITCETLSVSIDGEVWSSADGSFSIPTTNMFRDTTATVTAVDKYGLSASATYPLQILAYGSPAITALSFQRFSPVLDEHGVTHYELDDESETVWLNLEGMVSPLNGLNAWTLTANSATMDADSDGGTLHYYRDRAAFTARCPTSQDTEITVTLTDQFETSVYSFTVSKSGGIFNIEAHGVAVGMRTTGTSLAPKFECAWPATFLGGITGVTAYAEAEVPTGGAWIDGKPVYKKLITFTDVTLPRASSADNIFLTQSDPPAVDWLLSFNMLAHVVESDEWYALSGTRMWTTSNWFSANYYDDGQICLRYQRGSALTLDKVLVELQYTKAEVNNADD